MTKEAHTVSCPSSCSDYEPARPYLATLRNELLNGDNWESAVNFGEYYISDTEIKTSIDWKVLKTEGNRRCWLQKRRWNTCPLTPTEFRMGGLLTARLAQRGVL